MSAATKANAFLEAAVRQTIESRVTVVTNAPGRAWRAAALLSFVASGMHAGDAFGGALRSGNLALQDVASVMQDGLRVEHSVDSIHRGTSQGRYVDVVRQAGHMLGTVSKYEPSDKPTTSGKHEAAHSPSRTKTSPHSEPGHVGHSDGSGGGESYKSADDFKKDFGL